MLLNAMALDDYLPHYERELGLLRQLVREFVERYPKIAARMELTADVSENAHVEHLIQSFALLMARVSRNIDDEFSEFTEALLSITYPHYLRPFPPSSIARFQLDGAKLASLSAPTIIPRGKELLSRPVSGVQCRFRTVYDVTLSALQLTGARFHGVAQPPQKTRLPAGSSAQISLDFAFHTKDETTAVPKLDTIRLFIDGEASFCGTLRDALASRVLNAYVEPARSGRWVALDGHPLSPVGFGPGESLIPPPAEYAHDVYRLLTEFFAFPEKFNFFDLNLKQIVRLGGRQFTLHLVLRDVLPDSPIARALEHLGPQNVLLGCTPIVNLFQLKGRDLDIGNHAKPYPVIASEQNPHAYEVYAIDHVARVEETPHGEVTTVMSPLYSLGHGERRGRRDVYWVARRDALVAQANPGDEWELQLVNEDAEPVIPAAGNLDVTLTCTNRDLPSRLAYRTPGGDLQADGGSVASSIALLRKPTSAMRFKLDRGGAWKLNSQLSLNHLVLQGGAGSIREILELYDLPRTPVSGRLIRGLMDISSRPTDAWMAGKSEPRVVKGLEIELSVDEEAFAGTGLHLFAQIMERFFALFIHANGFTELVLRSKASGGELLRCERRLGDIALV